MTGLDRMTACDQMTVFDRMKTMTTSRLSRRRMWRRRRGRRRRRRRCSSRTLTGSVAAPTHSTTPRYSGTKSLERKEDQFNFNALSVLRLGDNVNNTKIENFYVTPSSPTPPSSSLTYQVVCLLHTPEMPVF